MSDETIFFDALALTNEVERSRYLDRVCTTAEQRQRLANLLAAHAQSGSFLKPLPDLAFTQAYQEPTSLVEDHIPKTTLVAGRYKLIELIGEGGMGEVWLAQQTEPVKRTVAVKLIKAGMDSKNVIARFEAERQALAVMDHPNVAKILDGGVHEQRPFFVMELVKGVPITTYCDERQLAPQARLELFIPVCHAIQHAHMKGIIHRDIKPSNVLVALYDDVPVPKVIDFGVAKATGPTLTDHTLQTGFGAVVGTPEYMSPEQASFNQLDVDTRSDVYALGVLLYELLTGTTPVDRQRLGKAAVLEVLRIVREVDVPKPSQQLSTTERLPSIAANRGTEPTKLTKLMQGELDWILLKSLAKDRNRRYESAHALANDVQRYLVGDIVTARPPSMWYNIRKLIARHKIPVFGTLLFLGCLLTFIGLLAVQVERALTSEQEALAQFRTAQMAEQAEKLAKQELHLQFGVVRHAQSETVQALQKSEALRLATTALLRKPYNHDLTLALINEAVQRSADVATVSTALSALENMPYPRSYAAANVPSHGVAGLQVPFQPSEFFWYHPNGHELLVLNLQRDTIVVFDTRTRQSLRSFKVSEREPKGAMLENLFMEPSGRWLVGHDSLNTMKVWDVTTGKLQTSVPHRGEITNLVFNSKEVLVAVVGTLDTKEKNHVTQRHQLTVYSLPKLDKRMEFEANELFHALAFSHDGQQVAMCTKGTRVMRVWDVSSQKLLFHHIAGNPAEEYWNPAIAFSHDGKKLVELRRDGMAIWDLREEKQTFLLKPSDGARYDHGATFTPDVEGNVILVNPSWRRRTFNFEERITSDTKLRTFNLQTMSWGMTFIQPQEAAGCLCEMSRNGRIVVGVNSANAVYVWDITNGYLQTQTQRPGQRLNNIAIHPSGMNFVSQGDGELLLHWDIDDRGVLPRRSYRVQKQHGLIASDGTKLFAVRAEGTLETLESATLRSIAPQVKSQTAWRPTDTEFERRWVLLDGQRVLVANSRKNTLDLYSALGEQLVHISDVPPLLYQHNNPEQILVAQQGGSKFLVPMVKEGCTQFEFSTYRVHDATTGRVLNTINIGDHIRGAKCFSISTDGSHLAIIPKYNRGGANNSQLQVWDIDRGTRLSTLNTERMNLAGITFTDANGTELLTWSGTVAARWRVGENGPWWSSSFGTDTIRTAALSRDGRTLATQTQKELAVWDLATSRSCFQISSTYQTGLKLAFVAQGDWLLCERGSFDGGGYEVYPLHLATYLKQQNIRRLTMREQREFNIAKELGVQP